MISSKHGRTSIVSLASRSSYDEVVEEEPSENAQIYRIREISNRIAHEKAKRKSFCKCSQIRMIHIHLLGTKDKPISLKTVKPKAYYDYVSNGSEKFCDRRESCHSQVFGGGGDKQWKSRASSENGYPSRGVGIKKEASNRTQKGRWALIASHFRLGQYSFRGTIKSERLQSKLYQEELPTGIQRSRVAESIPNGKGQIYVSLQQKNDRSMPTLRHPEVEAFDSPEALQEDAAAKNNDFLDQRDQKLPSSFGKKGRMLPSFKTDRSIGQISKEAKQRQQDNLLQLPTSSTNYDSQQARFDENRRGRMAGFAAKRTGGLVQGRRGSTSISQLRKVDMGEMANTEVRLSSNGMSVIRLSDEFKKLESCRYLRIYKMK